MFGGSLLGATLGLSVAIQIAPSISDPEQKALLSGCESILSKDQLEPVCRLVTAPVAEVPAQYVAEVTWEREADTLGVRIELMDDSARATRRLAFDPTSPEQERWEAVGLVVAALVNAQISADESTSLKSALLPPSPPEPLSDNAAVVPQVFAKSIFLSVGVNSVAESTDPGWGYSAGPGLQLSFRAGKTPLRPTLGMDVGWGHGPLARRDLNPYLGMGLWPFASRSVDVGLIVLADAAWTRLSEERSGVTESNTVLRWGGEARLELKIPGQKTCQQKRQVCFGVGAFLGARALFPSADIFVQNQRVGVLPWLSGRGGVHLFLAL